MFQILRRLTGAAGAPPTLRSGQLAVNFVDGKLYIGRGDNGSGTATDIVSIGGIEAYVELVGNQTIGGLKTFSTSPVVPDVASDDNSGKAVNSKSLRDILASVGVGASVAWSSITGIPALVASLGGLTPAADRLPYITNTSGAMALATLTSFGRSLIDDANSSTARTTLGLGTIATQAAASVNISGGAISGATLTNVTVVDSVIDGGTF